MTLEALLAKSPGRKVLIEEEQAKLSRATLKIAWRNLDLLSLEIHEKLFNLILFY